MSSRRTKGSATSRQESNGSSLDSGFSSGRPSRRARAALQIPLRKERPVIRRDLEAEASLDKCPLCRALLQETDERARHFDQHSQELFSSGLHDDGSRFLSVQLALHDLMRRAALPVDNLKEKVLEKGLLTYPHESKRTGYRCQTCLGANFYRPANITFHRRKCPTGDFEPFCRFCDCVFESEVELKRHFERHSGTRNRCFPYDSLLRRIHPDQGLYNNRKGVETVDTIDLCESPSDVEEVHITGGGETTTATKPSLSMKTSSPTLDLYRSWSEVEKAPKEIFNAYENMVGEDVLFSWSAIQPVPHPSELAEARDDVIIDDDGEISAEKEQVKNRDGSDPVKIPPQFQTKYSSHPLNGYAFISNEILDPRRKENYDPLARWKNHPPRKNVSVWSKHHVTSTSFVPATAPGRLFFISYDYMSQYRFLENVNQRK